MRILYLSCHSILEFDELRTFEKLGIEYFSLGSYVNPQKPVDPIRPALTQEPADEYYFAPDREHLTKEFIDRFDVVIVMHVPEWIEKNWEVMKHKRVIWRTIGQSTPAVERRLKPFRDQGLQIVRYSPREANITDYIGGDAMIRFGKDPNEFGNWIGDTDEVITFAQHMKVRGEFCNYDAFVQLAQGYNARLYGTKNEASGALSGGFMTYEGMQDKMKHARVYIYTGTQPASYTLNFIEAFMTGIPMVCLGSKFATSLNLAGDVYEIPDIIQNGVNGFVSDDLNTLKDYIYMLLSDFEYAQKISQQARNDAIRLFGFETITKQWGDYLLS